MQNFLIILLLTNYIRNKEYLIYTCTIEQFSKRNIHGYFYRGQKFKIKIATKIKF
jgi:hypothetical protein